MEPNKRLVWSAPEYEERERSQDWFWALGIIVVTSSLASLIYGNYFFAILLILGGVLLGFFARRKPYMIDYELLNDKGLVIGNRLYPYEGIKAFWVQSAKKAEAEVRPMLFIHSDRAFMPIISIPIHEDMAEQIHSVMLSKNVAEEEMKEHPSETIMEALGF